MQKVKCQVCGKVVSGYVPRGGDGSLYRPRKHSDCDGRFVEGILVPSTHLTKRAPDKCPRCNGRGKVRSTNNSDVMCPLCKGAGTYG